jgi:L-seryl-tRNA(Ser) seleniumtransferase
MLGGGSVPTQEIPTWCAAMTFKGFSVDQVARGLRSQTPALMGRIRNDQLLLDFRTIQPQFDVKLFDLFANVLK